MTPQRHQLSRKLGFRKPKGAVVVARPSRWGNPFSVARVPGAGLYEIHYRLGPKDAGSWVGERPTADAAREQAVRMFRAALRDGALLITPDDVRRELAGRDVACWCPVPGWCHGDALLAIAGGEAP